MMIPELLLTPRILLVDDEPQGLWLRAQVMTSCGFTVVTADGPTAAMSLMAEDGTGKINLAILDYDMPVMNGCVLADQLRSMRPTLKIILYSGAVDIPQKEMTSVDAFVAKDEGPARLLDQIVQITRVNEAGIVRAAASASIPRMPIEQKLW